MISSISSYLRYFAGIRRRTHTFAKALPEDRIDWSPMDGEYTCGDILRHIGAVQWMDWRGAIGLPWAYPGHESRLGASKSEALACLYDYHQRTLDLLQDQPDTILVEKQPDLNGNPISAWRYLMAAIEHETHHRSQLASYFTMMDLEAPQLYGIYMESLPPQNDGQR